MFSDCLRSWKIVLKYSSEWNEFESTVIIREKDLKLLTKILELWLHFLFGAWRLTSSPEAQPSTSEPQEISGAPTRTHFTTCELEELDLGSSTAYLQFPTIPLWPVIQTILIIK